MSQAQSGIAMQSLRVATLPAVARKIARVASRPLVQQKQKLTVAFISSAPPDRGNLAEYGAALSREIANLENIACVHVFANKVDGVPDEEKVDDKLVIHRVWTLDSAPSIVALVEQVRRLHPDVVHINAGIRTWGRGRLASIAGASLGMLLRASGQRVVTTLHTIGDTVQLDQMGADIGWATRIGIKVATRLYLKANEVTVTLPSMKRALDENFAATNVHRVAHGSYGARAEAVNIAGPRILSFGFWGAFKNPDVVVNAVAELRKRGIPAELVIGGGPHPYYPEIYADLVRRYQDRDYVHFTGYVPEEDLGALFTSAAAVVLPYRTNAGASGVLNLARTFGRPVVVSQEPGLVEQLEEEGGEGLIFSTAEELTQALARVTTDPELQRHLGQKSLDAARRVTIATQAKILARLYE